MNYSCSKLYYAYKRPDNLRTSIYEGIYLRHDDVILSLVSVSQHLQDIHISGIWVGLCLSKFPQSIRFIDCGNAEFEKMLPSDSLQEPKYQLRRMSSASF
ncbi:hypothetical protein CUMW_129730 [Citrus unshiu]|nr:hypothetical protein CUMW_129730 [Citrus unshiu]